MVLSVVKAIRKFIDNRYTRLDYQLLFGKGARAPPLNDYQPLLGKGARAPPPNSRLDSWTLALLISINKISSCLNRAGCINYLSRSSREDIEVVRYEKRSH